jgi:hypothetical protein
MRVVVVMVMLVTSGDDVGHCDGNNGGDSDGS